MDIYSIESQGKSTTLHLPWQPSPCLLWLQIFS
jgi:hypothetical protein